MYVKTAHKENIYIYKPISKKVIIILFTVEHRFQLAFLQIFWLFNLKVAQYSSDCLV